MDAPKFNPDRRAVAAARRNIVTSTSEDKDALLTTLLCQSYHLRASQDS